MPGSFHVTKPVARGISHQEGATGIQHQSQSSGLADEDQIRAVSACAAEQPGPLDQDPLTPVASELDEPDARAHHGFAFFVTLRIREGVVDSLVVEKPVDLLAPLRRERRVRQ